MKVLIGRELRLALYLTNLFCRGVFQSLVEKHFPAPDRKRINRLLGLESVIDTSPVGSPSTSGGTKRKSGWYIYASSVILIKYNSWLENY